MIWRKAWSRALVACMATVMMLGTLVWADNSTGFTDVSDNAYYAEAIKWALANGITNGIGNNQFGVGQTVTRAQAVTFLWRSAGSPTPKTKTNSFIDVESDKNNSWYKTAVLWAVENGITNGVGNNQFNPTGNVTNQEMITFLYRTKGSPNATGQGQWYEDAVRWANAKGLFNGMPTKPNVETRENCLRENVVYLLWMEMKSANTNNNNNGDANGNGIPDYLEGDTSEVNVDDGEGDSTGDTVDDTNWG